MVPTIALVVALLASPVAAPAAPPRQTPVATIPGDRLGFEQELGSATLAAFTWAIVIDGVRSALVGVECAPTPTPSVVSCAVPVPALSTGVHVLELIAIRTEAGLGVESPRSAPFPVEALGPTAAPRGLRILRPAP